MFCLVTGYIIPVNVAILIYGIILYHVRQSSRRVVNVASTITNRHICNVRREMKLVRNILIQLTILFCGGALCSVVVLWQVIGPEGISPPEPLYLLRINSLTVFITVMLIVLFGMNAQMNDEKSDDQNSKRQKNNDNIDKGELTVNEIMTNNSRVNGRSTTKRVPLSLEEMLEKNKKEKEIISKDGKDQKSRDLALAQLRQEIMLESPVSQCLPQLLDHPDAQGWGVECG
ncbi:unnamed protein product [Rotaria sp. Silwood1]|nr:unnamed protein product [Rotaria sp. Silwood1]CAF3551215.1 unnamed protein product [Rotaria sp. Silwood1]